jgi:hypothetical protein
LIAILRPEVLEIASQQDEIVRALAETELEQLEAQGEEAEIEIDPTDSSNEDYHPIPQRPPSRAHNSEAVVPIQLLHRRLTLP